MSDTPTNITIATIAVAFLAAIPPTLMAWAALRQAKSGADKTDVAIAKTDVVSAKADVIHTLTNSNLTKVTQELEAANRRIEGLEKLIISTHGGTTKGASHGL